MPSDLTDNTFSARAVKESWKAFRGWRDVSAWERRKMLGKVMSKSIEQQIIS